MSEKWSEYQAHVDLLFAIPPNSEFNTLTREYILISANSDELGDLNFDRNNYYRIQLDTISFYCDLLPDFVGSDLKKKIGERITNLGKKVKIWFFLTSLKRKYKKSGDRGRFFGELEQELTNLQIGDDIKDMIKNKLAEKIRGDDSDNVYELLKNYFEGMFMFMVETRKREALADINKRSEMEKYQHFATRKDTPTGGFEGKNIFDYVYVENKLVFSIKLFEVDFDEALLKLFKDIINLKSVSQFIENMPIIKPLIEDVMYISEKHGDKLNDMIWNEEITMRVDAIVGQMYLRKGIYVLMENPPPTEEEMIDLSKLYIRRDELDKIYVMESSRPANTDNILDTNYLIFVINVIPISG